MIELIVFLALLPHARSHSWLECTDYDILSFNYDTLGNFDRARCNGYPRQFAFQFAQGFGVDTGYNWEHPECRQSFSASDYTSDIPMATYSPGQTIYISHPSKNHVADTCTNAFIPSTSMELLMSIEVGVDSYDYSVPLVGGDHVSNTIDHLGYQRCYDFCGNMDKAHCITAWSLPTTIMEGRHSFLWKWEFNPGQYYSNCFDAYISASGGVTSDAPAVANSSASSSSNDTITFTPSTTPSPSTTTPSSTTPSPSTTSPAATTPSPTEDFTIETQVPASTPTPTPTSFATSTAVPITSNASSLLNPLSIIGNYIYNISGAIDISGLVNVTVSSLRSLAFT